MFGTVKLMSIVSLAVFPGSFDPVTNGHLDIISRSSQVFEKVVVAVLSNPQKTTLFSCQERLELIKEVLKDCPGQIEVACFDGLLIDFAKKIDARVLIRGLRAVSDYEYELQMALMNRQLSNNGVETLFMAAREQNSYISSSIVKQVASFGADISRLVPPAVNSALQQKFAQLSQ